MQLGVKGGRGDSRVTSLFMDHGESGKQDLRRDVKVLALERRGIVPLSIKTAGTGERTDIEHVCRTSSPRCIRGKKKKKCKKKEKISCRKLTYLGLISLGENLTIQKHSNN